MAFCDGVLAQPAELVKGGWEMTTGSKKEGEERIDGACETDEGR